MPCSMNLQSSQSPPEEVPVQTLSKRTDRVQKKSQTPAVKGRKRRWACRRDGGCALFPDMDRSDVSVARINRQFRLFQTIQHQPDDKPDHVLQWGESRDDGLIVWSKFVAKTRRVGNGRLGFVLPVEDNTDHALRERLVRNMEKACADPSGKLHALGYTRLIQYSNVDNEVTWHIVNARRPSTRLDATPVAMTA